MEYEELTNLHPKIINWAQSWEFVFKYTKPLFDRYNSEWFYRWIAECSDKWDLWYIWNDYSYLKDNWRLIQKYLPNSWICPICGIKLMKRFYLHLSRHEGYAENTVIKYLLLRDKLTEIPKCKYCGSDIKPDFRGHDWISTCGSKVCAGRLNKELYGSNFSSELTIEQIKNRKFSHKEYVTWIENIHRSQSTRMKLTLLKYGNPNSTKLSQTQIDNIKKLYGFDDEEFSEYMKRRLERLSSLGRYRGLRSIESTCGSFGLKSLVYFDNKYVYCHSQYELWTLLKFIIIDNITDIKYSIRLYLNPNDSNSDYCISDFVFNNTNFEIHDESDIDTIEFKKLCTINNGLNFELISLTEAENYFYDLLDLGYNMWNIWENLLNSNKSGSPYEIKISELTNH